MKTRVASLEKAVSSIEDDVSDLQLDVSDIKASLRGHSEILSHINRVEITVAGVTEKADSAHKRLDEEKAEIDLLRKRTHDNANDIHRQGGILAGMETAVKDLITATKQNTQAVLTFRIIAITAMFMGTGFISFCGFVGGKLLHWW